MKLLGMTLFERRVIGEGNPPLLIRYILFRIAPFGIYLHKLLRSDHDRALHDHPWPFVSLILKTGYTEVHNQTETGADRYCWRPPGSVLLRPAEWRHRVILRHFDPMDDHSAFVPAWTLIFVGRRQRRWGFFAPHGWCWWRRYNYKLGICEDEPIWKEGKD